jgi:hypothetical protein
MMSDKVIREAVEQLVTRCAREHAASPTAGEIANEATWKTLHYVLLRILTAHVARLVEALPPPTIEVYDPTFNGPGGRPYATTRNPSYRPLDLYQDDPTSRALAVLIARGDLRYGKEDAEDAA